MLFESLLSLAFALHLLTMNVGAAGPLVCVWLRLRASRRDDAAAEAAGYLLARLCLAATTLGIVVGLGELAAMWFARDNAYFEAIARFPRSRYIYAAVELAFYFACMVPYVALWHRARRHPIWHGWLAVLAATNLLYHFPPLLAILSKLATGPVDAAAIIDRAAYRRLLVDPEVVSRVVHSWQASFAVTGMALMACAAALRPADDAGRKPFDQLVMRAARLAIVATLAQLPVGLWVLLRLPPAARNGMLGNDLPAAGLFATALLTSLVLMHSLAAVALGDVDRRAVLRTLLLMVLTVSLMACMRHYARRLATPTRRPVHVAAAASTTTAPPNAALGAKTGPARMAGLCALTRSRTSGQRAHVARIPRARTPGSVSMVRVGPFCRKGPLRLSDFGVPVARARSRSASGTYS